MRYRGFVATLATLLSLLLLLFVLGAADSKDKDSDSKGDSSTESSDTQSDKDALPLLNIPPAPVDDEEADSGSKSDKASDSGVTASGKLPPKSKGEKAGKSGTIASKSGKADKTDKSRAKTAPAEEPVNPDEDAVDVQVAGHVKTPAKAAASGKDKTSTQSSAKAKEKNNSAGTTQQKNKPAATPPSAKSAAGTSTKPKKTVAKLAAGSGKKTTVQKDGSKRGPAGSSSKAEKAPVSSPPALQKKSEQSLATYFDDSEQSNNSTETSGQEELNSSFDDTGVADPDAEAGLGQQPDVVPNIGVLNATRGKSQDGTKADSNSSDPTIAELLASDGKSDVGKDVPRANYLQSFAVLVLLVGCLLLLAHGMRRIQGKGGIKIGSLSLAAPARNMKVVESITLGPGKQIMVVELHGELLVLGATPNNISLLDKLPASSGSAYQGAVNSIIRRELSAGEAAAPVAPRSLPPVQAQPQPQPRVVNGAFTPEQPTVAELRRARAGLSLAEHPADAPRWSRADNGGSALISKIREQLAEIDEA